MSSKFDELYSQATQKGSSKFDSIYKEATKEKTTREKSDRAAASFTAGGASSVLSSPRAVTGLLRHGSRALAEKGREQALKEGRDISEGENSFTNRAVDLLSYPDRALAKLGLPTYEEARAFSGKRLKGASGMELPDQGDQTGLEKGLETAGNIIGGSVVTPGGAFGSGAKALTTGLASVGAGLASSQGSGAGGQIAGAIGLPTLVNLIKMIKGGKLNPTGAQAKLLYEEGKALGLSDKELTPLLKSQTEKNILGTLGKPTGRVSKALKGSEDTFGTIYEGLKKEASNLPPISQPATNKIINRFNDLADNLRKNKLRGPGTEQTIKSLEDSVLELAAGGITPEELIETWQGINKNIDWKSLNGGKKYLNSLKEPMMEALRESSPQFAKKFETTNLLRSRLYDVANKYKPGKLKGYIEMGGVGALTKGLYDLVIHGNTGLLKAYAGKEAIQRLSNEIFMNPRFNNLTSKFLKSANPASKQATVRAFREFREGLKKEDPELYKELDFDDIDLD